MGAEFSVRQFGGPVRPAPRVDEAGRLKRVDGILETTFVPVIAPAADGILKPDLNRIKRRKDLGETLSANLLHLQNNIAYYARERIVRIAFAYGEAAAFVRTLHANGLNVDVGKLP